MREVKKIKYTTVVQGDVSDDRIYAFANQSEVSVLVKKNGFYFWKSLCETDRVWYKEYKSLEEAITGIYLVADYKASNYTPIQEFYLQEEFLKWAHEILTYPLSPPKKPLPRNK